MEKSEGLSELKELNKKIEVVIALLLKMLPKDNQGISLKDQIKLLDSLHIRPSEIAEIIGRTQSYVSKELVYIRKDKKQKIN